MTKDTELLMIIIDKLSNKVELFPIAYERINSVIKERCLKNDEYIIIDGKILKNQNEDLNQEALRYKKLLGDDMAGIDIINRGIL